MYDVSKAAVVHRLLALVVTGLGVGVAYLGYAMHGGMGMREMILGLVVALLGALVSFGMWVWGRFRVLRDAYVMGYRHGRRDANAQLLEDGLWLADRSEQHARRNLDEP